LTGGIEQESVAVALVDGCCPPKSRKPFENEHNRLEDNTALNLLVRMGRDDHSLSYKLWLTTPKQELLFSR
jgi:hypothetical protein